MHRMRQRPPKPRKVFTHMSIGTVAVAVFKEQRIAEDEWRAEVAATALTGSVKEHA